MFEAKAFEELDGELRADGGEVFGVDGRGVCVGENECGDLERDDQLDFEAVMVPTELSGAFGGAVGLGGKRETERDQAKKDAERQAVWRKEAEKCGGVTHERALGWAKMHRRAPGLASGRESYSKEKYPGG